MNANQSLDKFLLREIEQKLAAELQVARESARAANTEQEKRMASEGLERALRRFRGFAANGAVPEDLL
jgi:hypothetical protein